MQIALIGWQGGGKSTLFSALTGTEPSVGEQVHPGVAGVPDERLDKLCELLKPEKKSNVIIEYFDAAGHTSGQSKTMEPNVLQTVKNAN